jgi:hypothetical protein
MERSEAAHEGILALTPRTAAIEQAIILDVRVAMFVVLSVVKLQSLAQAPWKKSGKGRPGWSGRLLT